MTIPVAVQEDQSVTHMNKKDHVADKLFYHEHLSCMVLEVRGDTLAATAESNTKFPLV